MSQSLFPRYTVSSDECHPRHDVEIPKITPFGSPLPDMRSINSPPPAGQRESQQAPHVHSRSIYAPYARV